LGGKVTCTLGEVRNRADLVIYWGGNPAECHPRHFTKYALMPKGKHLPRGRKDRTMVLVDIRETKSVKAADIFLQIRPGRDFEVLTILRAIVKDQYVNPAMVADTGLKIEQLRDLVDRMKRARFGVMFFGMGLSMTRGKHHFGRRIECIHEVCGDADARARECDGGGCHHALDDRLSVRDQL
jgi:formylmethanofuran dehydrogenase subunit B